MEQVGPGEYKTHAQVQPESLCTVTAYRSKDEILASTEIWIPSSLEHGPLGPDAGALSKLAASTGGRVLNEEAFLNDEPEGKGGRGYDMWWVLLILAGCFFMADIIQASLLSARKLK
jgi:hypothetical protein